MSYKLFCCKITGEFSRGDIEPARKNFTSGKPSPASNGNFHRQNNRVKTEAMEIQSDFLKIK